MGGCVENSRDAEQKESTFQTKQKKKDFNPNQHWSNDACALCYSRPFWANVSAIISPYLKYTKAP